MSDEPSDQSDAVKPWTIKGIPPETRNAAIASAAREKQTLGEFVGRAILAQIKSDRQQNRAPVPVGPSVSPAVGPSPDLEEIERIVAMTAQLATAGAPPTKANARAVYALLTERLNQIKKRSSPTLPPESPTKTATGPTDGDLGPTEEG